MVKVWILTKMWTRRKDRRRTSTNVTLTYTQKTTTVISLVHPVIPILGVLCSVDMFVMTKTMVMMTTMTIIV